jgi:hypothetical protein
VEFVLDIAAMTQVFSDYVISPQSAPFKFSRVNVFDKNTL